MKKIWKNLCVCSMALACGVGLFGCGKTDAKVSKDLDGDGQIASWETLFNSDSSSSSSSSDVTIVGEIIPIKSDQELLAINDDVKASPNVSKIYVLQSDIDLGGQEVCINLGKSELYGNSHVISNFKLGTYYAEDYISVEEGAEAIERTPSGTKCLFYGGGLVYGVNVFMGVQTYNLDSVEISNYRISPFVNTSYIDHVSVKGKIDITVPNKDGRNDLSLDTSLLYSQEPIITINGEVEVIENHITDIRNVNVDGVVSLVDSEKFLLSNIGGVASTLSKESVLYNANVQLDINATSANVMNLGGAVGTNNGFLSTANVKGTFNTSFTSNTSNENVGGIVGVNGSLAEVKNCSTSASITFKFNDILSTYNRSAKFNYGGIAGHNAGGVLEYVQSDTTITAENVSNIYAGGIVGRSDKGIISYALCRGSISLKNVNTILASQVSGFSNKGLIEKIITTTGINVDNSGIVSEVNVGMVTIFEDVNNLTDDYTAQNSPYFRSILVDGVTEVYMKKGDAFRYALGLRNQYKGKTGENITIKDDDGNEIIEPVYESRLPEIFSDLYYTARGGISTTGCQLFKYEDVDGQKNENHPTITYARDAYNNKKINESSNTTSWIIDALDFKNYLNHNEVNLTDKVVFGELKFTLDKSKHEKSYFGDSKYNGELAYFDREFTQSYTHEDSAIGSCEYDTQDEFMSFIYNLITNGQGSSSYAIKVADEFLDVDWDNPEQSNIKNFQSIIENAFVCLNTSVSVTSLNTNKEDISAEVTEDQIVKYLKATFEDTSNYYTILFDIENLRIGIDNEEITKGDYSSYIVYLTFSVVSKPTAS